MAVQGSGLGKGPDDGAFKDQTHYDARSGAAKRTQTSYPTTHGMKDMTTMSRVGPTMEGGAVEPNPAYHFGPDASSANPSDPETPAQRGKTLRRQPDHAYINAEGDYTPGKLKASWGMKGGMGQDVSPDLGGKVLGEAILSGSHLPASTSEASGAGPTYTGKDPN